MVENVQGLHWLCAETLLFCIMIHSWFHLFPSSLSSSSSSSRRCLGPSSLWRCSCFHLCPSSEVPFQSPLWERYDLVFCSHIQVLSLYNIHTSFQLLLRVHPGKGLPEFDQSDDIARFYNFDNFGRFDCKDSS